METTRRHYVSDLVKEVGSITGVAAEVVNLTSGADCDFHKLGRIIKSDGAMTMRFLALANSAALSRGHEVRELKDALVRLGSRKVRNVALLMGMHDMQQTTDLDLPLETTEFWKFSLATASCAQGLAELRNKPSVDDAWLVGILHTIGIPVLMRRAGDGFRDALVLARESGLSLADAELQTLEFHHGELGGRILEGWNLPRVFAEAIEYQAEEFAEDEVSEEARDLIAVLRDAIAVVRAIGFGDSGDGDEPRELEEVLAQAELDEWALTRLSAKISEEVGFMADSLGFDLPPEEFNAALVLARLQLADIGMEGFEDTLSNEELEDEMAKARDIQQNLLPDEPPTVAGYRLAAVNEPSRRVSGDIYDFLKFAGGDVGLLIADVSGKGMPASLLASNLQATVRALTRVYTDPGQLLKVVNETVYESTEAHSFVTVFLAVLNPDTGTLRYANAGHNPPMLLRRGGRREWLEACGTPVGMLDEMEYPVAEVVLAPGDLLVTYTDGITEATNDEDEEFEEAGLERVVRELGDPNPGAVVTAVLTAVRAHVSSHRANPESAATRVAGLGAPEVDDAGDDLTLVVLARDP